MSVIISGDTGLAGAATGALNGSLGATTPSTVVATTISASGAITATGGVVVGASAAPAFSASLVVTNQSITSGVATKLQFSVENFDTNSNYNTTNYRFTPTVAGYYQINLSCYASGTALTQQNLYIYKNGSAIHGTVIIVPSSTVSGAFTAAVIYCNGSTDYIEAYALITGTSPIVQAQVLTSFNGCFVRSA